MSQSAMTASFPVRDYDLAATLTSGQAFRWKRCGDAWEGVVAGRWVELRQEAGAIVARAAEAQRDWNWLRHYLQIDVDLEKVLATFPNDDAMRASVTACRGLRLLRQDPWECLASFILSSTKQIVQIQQIVRALCECVGSRVTVPAAHEAQYAFPTPEQVASAAERDLRACKMGFRAPNLLATARMVAAGEVDLARLAEQDCETARTALVQFPGVGEKIANCVLLFAYGFQDAFPVDVWVRKALLHLYFPRRRPSAQRLERFIRTYFGPNAGYAQQYLFHYMRTQMPRTRKKAVEKRRRKAAQ
jgi:N-glycosylase/DNA lyase